MTSRPTEEFLANLRASRLLGDDQVAQLGAVPSASAEAVAASLVTKGLLTAWQSNELLRGRTSFFLGRYKLLDRLDAGGMGVVYRAIHEVMGRVVALKLVRESLVASPEAGKRFQREIRAAAALEHLNIVRAYDADQVGDVHFLVMEYIEGEDLETWVEKRGPLPVRLACEFCRQAARGLEHAHQRGMVHRDIKPSNILVTRSPGKAQIVKVLDFGIARFESDTTAEGDTTGSGHLVGTPDFIAPEQIKDPKTTDVRADIYSLGCSLFFLLTGRPPFAGDTPVERMLRRLSTSAPQVRALRADVPPDVQRVVSKALARFPRHRHQTAQELAADLKGCVARARRRPPEEPAADSPGTVTPGMARGPGSRPPPEGRRFPSPAAPQTAALRGRLLAALCLFLALLSFIIGATREKETATEPSAPRPQGVTAFSAHGYYVSSRSLQGRTSVDIPLETNCRVNHIDLLDRTHPENDPVRLTRVRAGALTNTVSVSEAFLRAGGRYSLQVVGTHGDGSRFRARKSLEVHREPIRVEKVAPPAGVPLGAARGTIKLRIPSGEGFELLPRNGERATAAGGVSEIPYDLGSSVNCVHPVAGSETDVLVPVTVATPWGTESTTVLHYEYAEPRTYRPLFRERLIDGKPCELAGGSDRPVVALAGASVDLHYTALGWDAGAKLRVSLKRADGDGAGAVGEGRLTGKYSLTLPAEPGVYALDLEVARGADSLHRSGPWFLRVLGSEGVSPPEITALNSYQKWQPTNEEVRASPPLYVIVSSRHAPRCTVNGVVRPLLRSAEDYFLELARRQQRERISFGMGTREWTVDVRWGADQPKCRLCRPAGRSNLTMIKCPDCEDGKVDTVTGTIRAKIQCPRCGGEDSIPCTACGGRGFAPAAAFNAAWNAEALALRQIAEAFRAADSQAALAAKARSRLLDSRQRELMQVSPDSPDAFAKAEEDYWDGIRQLRAGSYRTARGQLLQAAHRFTALSRRLDAAPDADPHRSFAVDRERGALENAEKERRLELRTTRLAELEKEFRGRSNEIARFDLGRDRYPRIATLMLASASLEEDGRVRRTAVENILRLAKRLLRPGNPREALADEVLVRPERAGWPPLTREALRVLEKLPEAAWPFFQSPEMAEKPGDLPPRALFFYLVSALFVCVAVLVWRRSRTAGKRPLLH